MKLHGIRGFTLIELMIVIAIIAVLASIALPAYQDYIGRTQMTEAMTLASGMKAPTIEVYSNKAICPTSGSDGIPTANAVVGHHVAEVSVGGITPSCTIIATMKPAGVVPLIQGKLLTLRMTANSGSYSWTCTSNAMQKYLPTGCTGV